MNTKSLATVLISAALSGGGCLLVTPLDELPAMRGEAPSTSGSGGVADGGASAAGGAAGEMSGAGSGGSGIFPDGTCQTNAQCIAEAADEPARCRPSDHKCVPLRDEACPVVVGEAEDPNAVYFGAFASLDGVTPEDNSIVWAHQLALDELSGDSMGGLPDGVKGRRRPLVMIVCNNLEDLIQPSLKHLIENVQVPAVLATLKPGDLRRAYEEYAAHDVFYLSPVSVTKSIASVSDEGRIWNLLGQPSDFAPTYAALLARSEAWLRADRELGDAPIRVALVATRDAFDSELRDAVTTAIHFNGQQTAAENEESDQFRSITLDPDAPELATQAAQLAEFAPDIVISTASDLFLQRGGLQDRLETEWGVLAGGKKRPFYILSPYDAGNVNTLRDRISGVIQEDPNGGEDNERYVGVTIAPPADVTLQRAYEVRLRSLFKDAILDTANYYDATYYLAYAMYAADQPAGLTGSGISAGMQRLFAGKQNFDVGPGVIGDVFDALRKPGSFVHLNGTLGPPEIDVSRGVRPVDGGVFCFSRTGTSARVVPNAARFDRDQEKFVGSLAACNPDF
ncbi:MAG: ABC transporter substrate-binding protein [Myxococcales bacterium]|nr:MAG: ABC transporter substrate-binding protein [Myxococcales bacterium]